jgi:glycosyltransferase involved in cell wall biosynthesis
VDRVTSHYIAITDRVLEHYRRAAFLPAGKITRVYYGYELPAAGETPAALRTRHSIPPESFVVGFVGRLTYQKNVPLLIEAARQLPQLHFVFVGEGELKEQLLEQAGDLPNLQFLGYQPNAHEIMACFDLFCLPSRFEGLGLVLLEAMLRRVPILASRAGAIPEILEDGKYGWLFDSQDLPGLVAAIRQAVDHPEERKRLAARAYAHAGEAFSVQRMAYETIQVYERVRANAA